MIAFTRTEAGVILIFDESSRRTLLTSLSSHIIMPILVATLTLLYRLIPVHRISTSHTTMIFC